MDAYCTSGNSPTLEALCEKYGLPVIADLHGFSPQTQAITSIDELGMQNILDFQVKEAIKLLRIGFKVLTESPVV